MITNDKLWLFKDSDRFKAGLSIVQFKGNPLEEFVDAMIVLDASLRTEEGNWLTEQIEGSLFDLEVTDVENDIVYFELKHCRVVDKTIPYVVINSPDDKVMLSVYVNCVCMFRMTNVD